MMRENKTPPERGFRFSLITYFTLRFSAASLPLLETTSYSTAMPSFNGNVRKQGERAGWRLNELRIGFQFHVSTRCFLYRQNPQG
jgi:hypothetical protein